MQEYDEKNPATHKGYDLRSMPMAALYKAYGLDPMTVDFIGHALALHRCIFAFRMVYRLMCIICHQGKLVPLNHVL